MNKPSFLLIRGCGAQSADNAVRIGRQITRIVPVTTGFGLSLTLRERDIPDPQLRERARERSPPASQDECCVSISSEKLASEKGEVK